MTARSVLLPALLTVVFVASSLAASGAEKPVVVVFYREDCEECARMEPVLRELEALHPDLGFRYIEGSDPDAPLMWSLSTAFGVVPSQFPVIFVGKTAIVGASRANELLLRSEVAACAQSSCPSPLDLLRPSRIPWLTILLIGLAALVLVAAFLA
jgi:thiol-disulfide isomerase/thioredoxin